MKTAISFAQANKRASGEFQLKKGTGITQGFPIFYTEENYPQITFSTNTNSALNAHNLVIQAQINQYNAWLNRQKNVFKDEIQEQLGQNFSDFEKAQKEFYKDKELKNVKASARPLKDKYENKTNLKKEIRSRCIRNIKLLNLRANEINAGNVNNSRYGHLKYGSTPISEIRSANQVNNLRAQEVGEFNSNQWRLDQELKIHDFIKDMAVLNNRNHDILKDISRNQLNYYNRYGNDWDKLDLMQAYIHDTYYLASPYAPSGGVLNYGQESYVEWYGIEQFPAKLSVFHPNYWETIVSYPTGPVVAKLNAERLRQEAINAALNEVSTPDFLADVAIAGLGARNEAFVNAEPDLENEVEEYFKVNDFSKVSSDCMNYLLNQLQDGGEFTPNTSLYESLNTPLYQNAQNPNRALNWQLGNQAVREGFTNFGNVLAALFKDNAYSAYEGRIIRDMFGVNGIGLYSFAGNNWYGSSFHFTANDGTSVNIEYESEFAKETVRILNNGSAREKNFARAITNGDPDLIFNTLLEGSQLITNPCYPQPQPCPEEVIAQLTVAVINGFYDGVSNLAQLWLKGVLNSEQMGAFVRRYMTGSGYEIPLDIDNETLGRLFKIRTRGRQVVVEPILDEWREDMFDFGISLLDLAAIISPTRAGSAYFLVKAGNGTVTKASVSAYFRTLQRIARTTLAGGRGHKTFAAFKRIEGNASSGNALHHIVEQNGFQSLNTLKFGSKNIHNTKNILDIPTGTGSLHNAVTSHYARIHDFTNGKRFREWVAQFPFERQYEEGIKVLKQYGWDGVTGIIY